MNPGGCQLHIPHKKWSGDPHEEQNYLSIERWALRLPTKDNLNPTPSTPVSLATLAAPLSLAQVSRGVWSSTYANMPSGFTFVPINTTNFAETDTIGGDIQPTSTGFHIGTQGITVYEGTVHYDFSCPVPPIGGAPNPWDTGYEMVFHGVRKRRREGPLRIEFSGGFFNAEGTEVDWSVKQTSGSTRSMYMEVTITHIQM